MEIKETTPRPSLCLNMIVKNESHIIEKTFDNLCDKFRFDYWVISDTGSTDNTPEIIKSYFNKKNIPGELHHDPWKDFAHNRTLALNEAFGKTDLLLIFDADDEIHGNINMPTKVEHDEYHLKFGDANGSSYTRVLLINNHKKFAYFSVLHEFISSLESSSRSTVIEGDYYVVSGRSGNRSKNPNKYLDDARVLEAAHKEALAKGDALHLRYAFYCANSYKDAGRPEDAIKWYKITLQQDNWNQEKYMSCIHLYDCYVNINQKETGFYYLVEAFKYDDERVECLYNLLTHYCCNNMHDVGYNYYLIVKNFMENRYLKTNMAGKLFLDVGKFNFFVPYYMILIADKVQKFETVIKMYEIIFIKKHRLGNDWWIKNLLYNLQFFFQRTKDPEFLVKANDYFRFLYNDCKIPLHTYDFLKDYSKYGIDTDYIFKEEKIKRNATFSLEECKNSKNILFYTGFAECHWNFTHMSTNALGGSEKAVNYLSKYLAENGYNVYVSGDVKAETIHGVNYVHLRHLNDLLKTTPFEIIIISRYVGFLEMYKDFSCSQLYIWAHDTGLLPYGCNLDTNDILKKWKNYITGCICQTVWHKQLYEDKYPELRKKITVINNGINIETFKTKHLKQSNKFIYTSCSERGLKILLDLWTKILEKLPDATLSIASYSRFPKNDDEIELKKIIDKYPESITHVGTLGVGELYEEMSSSEYWLYPCIFPETSCITSLEMLASEVVCLYYPCAGLPYTMNGNGIEINPGDEIEKLMSLTQQRKTELRANGRKYVETCGWKSRSLLWIEMFNNLSKDVKPHLSSDTPHYETVKFDYNTNFIKIVNLRRREDRLNKMKISLTEQCIPSCEIFEAVDGKNLKPSKFIEKLFEGNDFKYRKGVIGCALSHYKLWKKLASDDMNQFYVILEDDITFVDNFKQKLEKVLEEFIKNSMNICMIGGNSIKIPNNDIANLSIYKSTGKIVDGTYGYIVSKNGANMMLNYISQNKIKRAIDTIYVNTFSFINYVNEYLVFTPSYQLYGNDETDIQLDMDAFDFSKINDGLVKIAFTDWWRDEYCGGDFDANDNFFTNLLKEHENIEVVEPNENPDILIYSLFGNSHKSLNAKRKIFYTGNACGHRVEADYNISFDLDSPKNSRVPIWVTHLNNGVINDCVQKARGQFVVPHKTKFCSLIAGCAGQTNYRKEITEKLSKYKKVDCGGNYLNNLGYNVPRGLQASGKIIHNMDYKFCIAVEHENYPNYVTEKMLDAYKSRCIPIYWGCKEVVKDFNPSTFINANDFNSIDELVEHVKKVDNDDELFRSYFKEPVFTNYWLDVIFNKENKFFKDLVKNIVNI